MSEFNRGQFCGAFFYLVGVSLSYSVYCSISLALIGALIIILSSIYKTNRGLPEINNRPKMPKVKESKK